MIKLVQGFDIGAQLPIDSRILLSQEEIDNNTLDPNVMPEKYFAISKEDGRVYLYTRGEGFVLADQDLQDQLNEEIIARETDVEELHDLISDLTQALQDEYARAVQVENELSDRIDAEEQARINRDNALQADIDAINQDLIDNYSRITNTGSKAEFVYDSEHFKISVRLRDLNNNVIDGSESAVIDLPVESLVAHVTYVEDSEGKALIIELENGEKTRVPVDAIIEGLATQASLEEHIDNNAVHIVGNERQTWTTGSQLANSAVQRTELKDMLLEGDNVTLEADGNNVIINAVDTTYSPGEGIRIENNIISAEAASPSWDKIEGNDPLVNESLDNLLVGNSENPGLITNLENEVSALNAKVDTKEPIIDANRKISSDFVNDADPNANKFVTAFDKDNWNNKQDNLVGTQTAYEAMGSATKVAQITTNNLGQVTNIEEVEITHPAVGDGDLIIQKNGTQIGTFDANAFEDVTINVEVPVAVSELDNDSNYQSDTDVAGSISDHNIANDSHQDIRDLVSANAADISDIEVLIPSDATSSNQLADKNFVNTSISTATATFKGTYNSLEELEQQSADENDYGFVISTDAAGNTIYNRYKYAGGVWRFEYALNNSSFTAEQWAAIQSGITSTLVGQITTNKNNIETNTTAIAGKQATLVSGTNIKTINNSSVLGSGNLSVGTVTRIQVAQGDDADLNKVVIGGDNDIRTTGTVKLYHASSGVTPNAYGPSSAISPAPGSSFNVPAVTVDKSGHITAAVNRAVTIPNIANGYGLSVENSGYGIKSAEITILGGLTSANGSWQESTLSSGETIYKAVITDADKLGHITTDSTPVLDVVLGGVTSVSDIDNINEAWSKIYSAQTTSQTITFYATELPAVDLTVLVKG